MPNGWKTVYHRRDSDRPVISWFHGQDAEKTARAKVADLAESGITAQIFERVDGEWQRR